MSDSSLRTVDQLLSLQQEFERAMMGSSLGGTTSSGVYPPVNLFNKGEDMVLMAELPGFQKENILIEIKKNLLRIAGERKSDQMPNASAHRLERKHLKFDRTIKLPFIVADGSMKAEYSNGLLVLQLIRAEEDKPKQIKIS
ncbi:MAG: Hsp20/alpha crystallin family protein [SAR324 cluster bacterium]|nr:Hsp20/alpha crystallin family protein [SAR324 cluster bacterium]